MPNSEQALAGHAASPVPGLFLWQPGSVTSAPSVYLMSSETWYHTGAVLALASDWCLCPYCHLGSLIDFPVL